MLDELKEKFKLDLYAEFERITFKQFVDLYLKDLAIHSEKNTIIAYNTMLKNSSQLNDIALEDIRFIHIQDCVNNMVKEGLKPILLMNIHAS